MPRLHCTTDTVIAMHSVIYPDFPLDLTEFLQVGGTLDPIFSKQCAGFSEFRSA